MPIPLTFPDILDAFFVREESSQGVFVLMNQSNHHQGTKLQGFMYLCNILVFVI